MSSTENDSNISPEDFRYLSELIFREAAIVIENEKEYLIDTRLGPLAKNDGIGTIGDLVHLLKRDPSPGLVKKVVNALTTNATSFYRDVHPFRAIQNAILPELIAARQEIRALNIWSAACSSGQEPYSIAMMLKDHFPQIASWTNYMLATDISTDMLDKAKSGVFRALEVNRGLPATQLIKHFNQVSGEWIIREEFRRSIDFREMNLAALWPPIPQMDIILLRNVMIYFKDETKKLILERTARLLRPDGYLILGASETTFGLDDSFEQVNVDNTLVFRKKR
ncbi:MAG: protein-glutamate O-methyltransferase CheR [Verrucomicrobiota bacterium]